MPKTICLTEWAEPEVDAKKVVNDIDNSINIEYVTLSDTRYAKRLYDVHCHKKEDIINVIDYFLEQERVIDGDDIEIVAMMLVKQDDEPFFVLNVALDFLDINKISEQNKEGSAPKQCYSVKGGVMYNECNMKVKDFNEKLFS